MRKNKTLYRIAFERVCFVADFSYRSKAFGFLLSMISHVAREGKATE